MNENVRKVFDMLGVEPNEKFRLKGDEIFEEIYYFDENLYVYDVFDGLTYINILNDILNETYQIIKLPKESKKKKLRDLTEEEFEKWRDKNCNYRCSKCPFNHVVCDYLDCWINHKDLYSNKFLEQEIEVE